MTTDQKTPGQVLYESIGGGNWGKLPDLMAHYEKHAQAVIAHDRANQPAASGVTRKTLEPMEVLDRFEWGCANTLDGDPEDCPMCVRIMIKAIRLSLEERQAAAPEAPKR